MSFVLPALLALFLQASPQAPAPAPPTPSPQTANPPAASTAPAAAPSPEDLARQKFLKGDLKGAEASYRALVNANPALGTARAGLIWALLEQQEVEKASQEVATGTERSPNSSEFLAAAGDVAFRKGDFGAAEKLYQRSFAGIGVFARAYAGMARIARAVSKHKLAKQFAENAYRRDPQDPEIIAIYAETRTKRSERAALLQNHLETAGYEKDEDRAEEKTAIATLKSLGDRRLFELVSPRAPTEVHLEELRPEPRFREGWGLRVSLNGGKPVTMLLDSGASGLTISRRAAQRFGIQPLVEGLISGIGDGKAMRAHSGFAERLTVGPLEYKNIPLDIVDENSIADRDGIIGTDVFDDFLITLDFVARKVLLQPLTPRPGEQPGEPTDRQVTAELKGFVPVYRFGHMLLLPVRVGTHPPGLFLLDTGAASNLVSNNFARDITKVNRDHNVRVQGLSGDVKEVFNADRMELEFAGFRQKNYDMLAFDFSSLNRSTGTELSGVLGRTILDLFTITFDYRDGMIKLEYRGTDASIIPRKFR